MTGALALEALHRQVLPFLLRRVKEDVLQDLPPKIIQDHYVELSPLQVYHPLPLILLSLPFQEILKILYLPQVRLYEDFKTKQGVEAMLEGDETEESKGSVKGTHIFQALQYLRKLCSHPLLVLNSAHPEYTSVMKEYGDSLRASKACPKLVALK